MGPADSAGGAVSHRQRIDFAPFRRRNDVACIRHAVEKRHVPHVDRDPGAQSDIGIGADIGGTGGFLGQFCQIGKSTRVFDITGTLQEFGQRDNIKRFALARQSLGDE